VLCRVAARLLYVSVISYFLPFIPLITGSTSSSSSDQAYCERLASQLRYEDLPDACHSYRLSSRRPTDPFAGMTAGAAVEARRALSEKRGECFLMNI
jgi:hypothetical protein